MQVKQKSMIKKEELRFGNKVLFDNLNKRHPQQRIVEVKELLENEVLVIDPVGLDLKLFYNSESVKPIPLTPEILERCGLKYHKAPRYSGADMWQGMPGWSIGNDEWLFRGPASNLVLVGYFNTQVQYLHQLQNLFFALTGKELNYNPNGK